MLNLILPPEVVNTLLVVLRKAGEREVGGILMGEHIGPNEFKVLEITVHRRGGIASFVRRIEEALGKLNSFFYRTDHDYRRYNYLGEWHSHPLFEPMPSTTDDMSMLQIVQDESVGANFAVLLIVKLNQNEQLVGTAHTYLPAGGRVRSTIIFDNQGSNADLGE
jgi:integrative and conjugative element protein (TIGR02256 family)